MLFWTEQGRKVRTSPNKQFRAPTPLYPTMPPAHPSPPWLPPHRQGSRAEKQVYDKLKYRMHIYRENEAVWQRVKLIFTFAKNIVHVNNSHSKTT